MPADDHVPEGWATEPRDTRERNCEWDLPPVFGVRHRLRVARSPEPGSVDVTRTHEATVEWTADVDLPAWLRAVAEFCTPYGRDRSVADAAGKEAPDPPDSGGNRTPRIPDRGAASDGRFRAAPADATVRPPDGNGPGLSDPYHYWNTPLARLRADDRYPDGVASATIDLVDCPDAVWSRASAVGATIRALPRTFDAEDHARAGLEVTTRERFRRADDEGFRAVGTHSSPSLDGIAALVEATIAPTVEEHLADNDPERALGIVVDRIQAVWSAFRHEEGDPYAIPGQAVDVATEPAEPR